MLVSNAEYQGLKAQIADLDGILELQRNEIEILQTERDEATSQLESKLFSHQNESGGLAQMLEESEAYARKTVEGLESQLKSMNESKSVLEAERDAALKAKEDVEAERRNVAMYKDLRLQRDLDKMKREYSELRKSYSDITHQNQALREQLARHEARIVRPPGPQTVAASGDEQLRVMIRDLERNLAEAQVKYEQVRTTLKAQHEQLIDCKEDLAQAKEELTKAQDDYNNADLYAYQADAEHASVNKALQDMTADLKALCGFIERKSQSMSQALTGQVALAGDEQLLENLGADTTAFYETLLKTFQDCEIMLQSLREEKIAFGGIIFQLDNELRRSYTARDEMKIEHAYELRTTIAEAKAGTSNLDMSKEERERHSATEKDLEKFEALAERLEKSVGILEERSTQMSQDLQLRFEENLQIRIDLEGATKSKEKFEQLLLRCQKDTKQAIAIRNSSAAAYEIELEKQYKEMSSIIKEYQDKTANEAHWQLRSLQARNTALEQDIKEANRSCRHYESAYNMISADKRRLEDSIRVDSDHKQNLQQTLASTQSSSEVPRAHQSFRHDVADDPYVLSYPLRSLDALRKIEMKERIPRCLVSPTLMKERDDKVKALRMEQRKRNVERSSVSKSFGLAPWT